MVFTADFAQQGLRSGGREAWPGVNGGRLVEVEVEVEVTNMRFGQCRPWQRSLVRGEARLARAALQSRIGTKAVNAVTAWLPLPRDPSHCCEQRSKPSILQFVAGRLARLGAQLSLLLRSSCHVFPVTRPCSFKAGTIAKPAIARMTDMTDLTEPSAAPLPAANGALPAEDAAGQTVAAIAEADKISAGKRNSTGR